MLRTILLVAGALIVGAALAVGGLFALGIITLGAAKEETNTSTASKAPAQTNESPKTTQASKTIPNMTAVAQLGETTDMGDRSFSVNDLQHGYVFPSNIPKPDAGNEFVLANVTITNKGTQPIPLNVWDFTAEDSSGTRRKAHAASQAPDPFPNVGSVAPGGEVTGNIAVEVRQGDPVVKVVYRPQR